jgi:uncharacterized membrane protein YhiD involved in acid resistance
MLDFLTLQTTTPNPALITIIYSVLLSFLLSSLIAFTYERTFRGLSYSRNYVQALILCSIIAATLIQAIGDSLARGLGMLGAMAIIRFRTNLKDPRDIVFMFAALASGIAAGVYGFLIAVVGTIGFCAAAILLYYSPLGRQRYYDGLLRFTLEKQGNPSAALEPIFKEHCASFTLVTLRESGEGQRVDYAYQAKLKRGKNAETLVTALGTVPTIIGVQLMLQESTTEL